MKIALGFVLAIALVCGVAAIGRTDWNIGSSAFKAGPTEGNSSFVFGYDATTNSLAVDDTSGHELFRINTSGNAVFAGSVTANTFTLAPAQ